MGLKTITRGALAVALIYVCFLMFKGATNILNALFVPLIIYLVTLESSKKDTLALYGMIFLFCALFINIQIFFVLFYCLIASVLTFLYKTKSGKTVTILLLTLTTGSCFWLGIVLTDFVFHTQINSIMLRILNSNVFLYVMIILIEAGIVSVLLFILSGVFRGRMKIALKNNKENG